VRLSCDQRGTDLPVHERSVAREAEGLLPRRRGHHRSHGWRERPEHIGQKDPSTTER
jgi:hypothetical protein